MKTRAEAVKKERVAKEKELATQHRSTLTGNRNYNVHPLGGGSPHRSRPASACCLLLVPAAREPLSR